MTNGSPTLLAIHIGELELFVIRALSIGPPDQETVLAIAMVKDRAEKLGREYLRRTFLQ